MPLLATIKELLKNYDWEQTGDLIDTDNKFMKKLKEGLKEILARTFFKRKVLALFILKKKNQLSKFISK